MLVLLAGLGGLLGQKTGTVSDTGSGATLEVEYPVITRPGLDSPWSVTVTRSGGFAGPVRLRTTSAYFDLFDENGFDPEPTASLQDDTWIEWEFAPPAGDTLAVGFDARLSPAIQSGAEATTELLDAGGETLASVTYRTRVAP